jgi:hypothetical protein
MPRKRFSKKHQQIPFLFRCNLRMVSEASGESKNFGGGIMIPRILWYSPEFQALPAAQQSILLDMHMVCQEDNCVSYSISRDVEKFCSKKVSCKYMQNLVNKGFLIKIKESFFSHDKKVGRPRAYRLTWMPTTENGKEWEAPTLDFITNIKLRNLIHKFLKDYRDHKTRPSNEIEYIYENSELVHTRQKVKKKGISTLLSGF